MSSFGPVHTGVIQGSCIGPLLFLLFINDITEMMDSSVTVKLYADELKIYIRINTTADFDIFQIELNKIVAWSDFWDLPISIPKCYQLSTGTIAVNNKIILSDNVIKSVNSIKDLGIIIDQNLHFDEHIKEITKKAYCRSNLIYICNMYSGHI
jgi:hypothetical protein